MQEIDATTVRQARVIVDSRGRGAGRGGRPDHPLRAGEIDLDHISTELGEVLAGAKPGRTSAEHITFFKSVGVAVQDAVAAQLVVRNGAALGLGRVVEL